ncbi:hypothetical protein J7L33_06705 [Candidatus Bathyarchaeota archaeon]|nr:hypothetical protein [Candidatus Bathyarchaeota archaeon]
MVVKSTVDDVSSPNRYKGVVTLIYTGFPMPRVFTRKEVAYLDSLIKARFTEKAEVKKPLTNRERQIRYRIRRKVEMMIRDLVKVYFAGLIKQEVFYKLIDLTNHPLLLLDDKYLDEKQKEMRAKLLLG